MVFINIISSSNIVEYMHKSLKQITTEESNEESYEITLILYFPKIKLQSKTSI